MVTGDPLLRELIPRFVHEDVAGACVLAAHGELDLHSADALQEALAEASRRSPAIVLDLGGVRFLDSSALAAVLEAYRRVRAAGGRFAVVASGHEVRRLLELTGLDRVLALAPSVDAAVADVSRS